MTWGTKIAIFYSFFVIVLVSLVVSSIGTGDHLVTEDYYAKELVYEAHIQALRNAQALAEPLQITYEEGSPSILLQYPQAAQAASGKVLLYRPSDARLDREIAVAPDPANRQVIEATDLLPGLWRVQVNWEAGGKAYYAEAKIMVKL